MVRLGLTGYGQNVGDQFTVIGEILGLVPGPLIARKYGFSTGFMSSLKKGLLEQQGYFRTLAGMKNKDKPGENLRRTGEKWEHKYGYLHHKYD